MKEGTWVQSLSSESAALVMQVRDGQVRFSQQSAVQEQIVMLVELGHLSIAQAQLVLERQLPITQQVLPMLSAASILLVRRIWFRNALLQWLHADTAPTETVVDAAQPGHSCDLAEANHQLTWVDQSQQLTLPDAGDWICAKSTVATELPQLSKWPSPRPRWSAAAAVDLPSKSLTDSATTVAGSVAGNRCLVGLLSPKDSRSAENGTNAAAVLELRGAAVSVDPAPSVTGAFSHHRALRSAPDATSTEQALISAFS